MDMFSLITLGGGLAFFLYGMHELSTGLEKMSGGKLERLLRQMTDRPLMGILLGMVITVAIQSSSALTVMLVGLVNSGLMSAAQTVGAILGSHIGTTLTAWILSLSGIQSDNALLKLMKPEWFSLIFALIGALFVLMSKKQKKRDLGTVLVGFAVLMYGMKLMQEAMAPLTESARFASVLSLLSRPLVGLLIGTVFTGLVQSSAVTVGILQTLSLTGCITCRMAIPAVLGLNIGTCMTAIISGIGVSREARKVSVIHVLSNAVAAVLALALLYLVPLFVELPFLDRAVRPVGIALIHTVFNVAATIFWLPFMNRLEPVADRLMRPGTKEENLLDERLLTTPAVALSECMNRTREMASLAEEGILTAFSLLTAYDAAACAHVREIEDKTDYYEDKLGSFLVELSALDLSEREANRVTNMLRAITDLERLGDHAVNLVETAEELHEKAYEFSADGRRELDVLLAALREITHNALSCFVSADMGTARSVEPLEQVIDDLTDEVKTRHTLRLQKGLCTVSGGFMLNDILGNVERISDHCSNIAVYVIEMEDLAVESHRYLNEVKSGSSPEFNRLFDEYAAKYGL